MSDINLIFKRLAAIKKPVKKATIKRTNKTILNKQKVKLSLLDDLLAMQNDAYVYYLDLDDSARVYKEEMRTVYETHQAEYTKALTNLDETYFEALAKFDQMEQASIDLGVSIDPKFEEILNKIKGFMENPADIKDYIL